MALEADRPLLLGGRKRQAKPSALPTPHPPTGTRRTRRGPRAGRGSDRQGASASIFSSAHPFRYGKESHLLESCYKLPPPSLLGGAGPGGARSREGGRQQQGTASPWHHPGIAPSQREWSNASRKQGPLSDIGVRFFSCRHPNRLDDQPQRVALWCGQQAEVPGSNTGQSACFQQGFQASRRGQ